MKVGDDLSFLVSGATAENYFCATSLPLFLKVAISDMQDAQSAQCWRPHLRYFIYFLWAHGESNLLCMFCDKMHYSVHCTF
jgi:hypothetical protein